MHESSPYVVRPVHETEHLRLRLVSLDAADDLLGCYADPDAWPIFNTDACTGDFRCATVEDVHATIAMWLECYRRQEFVRCSVVDRATGRVIGTTEMFGRVGAYATSPGILRIDLASAYERQDVLRELLDLASSELMPQFDVDAVVTKAVPEAVQRRAALSAAGYRPYVFPERGEHYFGIGR